MGALKLNCKERDDRLSSEPNRKEECEIHGDTSLVCSCSGAQVQQSQEGWHAAAHFPHRGVVGLFPNKKQSMTSVSFST